VSSLLVLGLGNVLCADDGVGISAVLQLLQRYQPARGVRVLDGGTMGLSLLPELERAEQAIFVDAIRDGDSLPGSLVRIEQEDVMHAAATRLSVHQIGVTDLLEGASLRSRCPRKLILCGVVPQSIELRFGLSPSVAAAVPKLIELVLQEAAALGKPFRERRHAIAGGLHGDLHRLLGL